MNSVFLAFYWFQNANPVLKPMNLLLAGNWICLNTTCIIDIFVFLLYGWMEFIFPVKKIRKKSSKPVNMLIKMNWKMLSIFHSMCTEKTVFIKILWLF